MSLERREMAKVYSHIMILLILLIMANVSQTLLC